MHPRRTGEDEIRDRILSRRPNAFPLYCANATRLRANVSIACTWPIRNSRFREYPSETIISYRSFPCYSVSLFEQRMEFLQFFFLRKTMALKKEIKHGTIKKETKNWYFILLLVEISTHAVFIIYFNTFFPLSNFEYGTVSRYNLRRVEQSFCPVFLWTPPWTRTTSLRSIATKADSSRPK